MELKALEGHIRTPATVAETDAPLISCYLDLSEGLSDATIYFNGRNVIWSVGENNHACESAHADPVAQEFFRRLSQVKWTRGSGGTIVGNDEYTHCLPR